MDTSNHRVTHQSRASVPAVASSGPEPEEPETVKQKKSGEERAIKNFSQCFGIFFNKKITPKTQMKTFSVVPEE